MPLIGHKELRPFSALIGQETVKNGLLSRARAALSGGWIQSFPLYGAPGMGKTEMALAYAREVMTGEETGEKESLIDVFFLNCKGKHNITSEESREFWTFVSECFSGQRRGIAILDEFCTQEATGSFNEQLKAFVSQVGGNPKGGQMIPIYGHDAATFKPYNFGVVLATWFPKRAAQDIKDRFPEAGDLRFEPYSPDELAEILGMQLDGATTAARGRAIKYTDYGLKTIARSLRGTARGTQAVVRHAVTCVLNDETWSLSKKTVRETMFAADIFPQGLSSLEVKILTALDKNRNGYKAAQLQSITGASGQDITTAMLYLQHQLGHGNAFQLFNPETNEPLTWTDANGKEWLQAGELVMVGRNNAYVITAHGVRICAILRASGFVKA